MKLELSDASVELIIEALYSVANMAAGQTQEPDLCYAEDYEEFELAENLKRRLERAKKLRAQWVLDQQTGERRRV